MVHVKYETLSVLTLNCYIRGNAASQRNLFVKQELKRTCWPSAGPEQQRAGSPRPIIQTPALVTLSLCVPPPLVLCCTGTLYGGSLWKTPEPMPPCAAPPLGLSWPREQKPLQGWHSHTSPKPRFHWFPLSLAVSWKNFCNKFLLQTLVSFWDNSVWDGSVPRKQKGRNAC